MNRESFPPPAEPSPKERGAVEGGLAEILKRMIESGARNLAPEGIRQAARDLKLPREAIHFAFSQLDETKHGLYRAVASELRQFLEGSNIADELARALTKLSFEVKMQVRFVPNEGLKRPQVSTQVRVRPSDAEVEAGAEAAPAEPAPTPARTSQTPLGNATQRDNRPSTPVQRDSSQPGSTESPQSSTAAQSDKSDTAGSNTAGFTANDA